MIHKSTPFIIVIFSLFIIGSAQAATYNIDYFGFNFSKSATVFTDDLPSFQENNTNSCSITLNAKVNISAATGDVIVTYRSPDNINVGTATRNDKSNYLCDDFGTIEVTTPAANGTYESRTNLQSPSSNLGFWKTQTHVSCDNVGPEVQIISNRNVPDSKGYVPNMFRVLNFNLAPNDRQSKFAILAYSQCNTSFNGTPVFGDANASLPETVGGIQAYIYPFNSSFTGNVTISVDTFQTAFVAAGSAIVTLSVDVVKSTGSTTNLFNKNVTNTGGYNSTINGKIINNTELTLDDNSLYFLVVNFKLETGGVNDPYLVSRPPQLVDIRINALEPNYVCGSFSECLNGSQSRTCVDTSGNGFANRIDFQSCFSEQEFDELILGFEELNTTVLNVLECKKDPFTCVSTPQNITIETPLNWKINFEQILTGNTSVFHEAMAFMTSAEAYSGQRSLEINYRPPKLDVVQSNPALICGNESTGFQASLNTRNLTATIQSEAFTFPSAFPAIQWAVKSANVPRQQYNVDFFGANPFCSPKTLCYGNCNGTMGGEYQVQLQELNQDRTFRSTTFRFEGIATSEWNVVRADINTSIINASAQYQILIATDVSDVYSAEPRRMFFDDFRLQNLNFPLIANCTDSCDGPDFVDSTEVDGVCFTVRIVNESTCADAFEESQQEEANTQPFEPIGGSGNGTIGGFFEDAGVGFVGFFFSPFFLYMAVWLALGIYTEYKIRSQGTVFGIIVLFGLISGTAVTIGTGVTVVPVWFGLIFIAIGGFLTYTAYNKMTHTNGGG